MARHPKRHEDVLFFLRARVKPGAKLERLLAEAAAIEGARVVGRPTKADPSAPLVVHGYWSAWEDGFSYVEDEVGALLRGVAALGAVGAAAINHDGSPNVGPYFRAFAMKDRKLVTKAIDDDNPTEEQLARFDALWVEDPPAQIRKDAKPKR